MARVKAFCSLCEKDILLFFEEDSEDYTRICELDFGEIFEHKCPNCGKWAAFTIEDEQWKRKEEELKAFAVAPIRWIKIVKKKDYYRLSESERKQLLEEYLQKAKEELEAK